MCCSVIDLKFPRYHKFNVLSSWCISSSPLDFTNSIRLFSLPSPLGHSVLQCDVSHWVRDIQMTHWDASLVAFFCFVVKKYVAKKWIASWFWTICHVWLHHQMVSGAGGSDVVFCQMSTLESLHHANRIASGLLSVSTLVWCRTMGLWGGYD